MVDWKVVVPSYNRVDGFKSKTLATLQRHKIPATKIYLFVANEEQKKLYEENLDPGSVGHIIVGEKGLPQVRNFIFNYFPKGTPIVSFDDDVRGFVRLQGEKLRDVRPDELAQLFDQGFEECKKAGARFWGDYPVPNGFFMSNTVSTDLKFIMGSFWGCFNPGKEVQIDIGNGEKEDYMRTIKFWELDGTVVRLNFLSHKTATYKESGGLQSDGIQKRIEREKETVEKMLKRWPQYVRPNPRRKSMFPEVLLIRQSKPKQAATRQTRKTKRSKKD